MATFGENVTRIREARGMKPKELADRLGVKAGQLSNWEADRFGLPSGATLLRFAKALECPIDELLLGVDEDYDTLMAREIAISMADLDPAVLASQDPAVVERLERIKALTSEFDEHLSYHKDYAVSEGRQTLTPRQAVSMRSSLDEVLRLRAEIAQLRQKASPDRLAVEAERLDIDTYDGYKQHDIPVIGEGEASPQGALFWDDGNPLIEASEWTSRPGDLTDPRAYAIRVRGDSMMPMIRKGMLLLVSPNIPVNSGDLAYVELHSGERLVKLARKQRTGWLLESFNQAYESRFVQPDEVGTLHKIVYAKF